jgi:hypothetical protein
MCTGIKISIRSRSDDTALSRRADAAIRCEDAAIRREDAAIRREDAAIRREDAAIRREDAAIRREDAAIRGADAAICRGSRVLGRLRDAYNAQNEALFDGELRRVRITLRNPMENLGEWWPDTRTIEIQREMVRSQPWSVVLEVLKHEMAHQYVDEVLGADDESPHGRTFQCVCRERGIDWRSMKLPPGWRDRGRGRRSTRRPKKVPAP